jgi:hypothetical protein
VFFVKSRALLVFCAALAVAVAPLSGSLAQTGSARLRIAHFSPDAPAIDVYFDGVKRLTNVAYEKHSNYLELPAGKHKIEVRATGSAADVPAVVSADTDLAANGAYTLAAIGKLAAITGKLYTDDTSAPPTGKVKLRVMHGAPDQAPVDVVVTNGQELAAKLAFPDASPYLTVDPGKYDVEVRPAGSTTPLLASTVVLQAGGVYSVAVIGGADKAIKLKGLIDVQPTAVAAVTTAGGTPATVAPSTAGAGSSGTEPAVETTVAATETTPAETTAPETTTADTIAPETSAPAPDTTTPAPETSAAAPDTTTPDVPAGGVESGAGGLAGGGAVGATALAGLAALAIASAARKRRAA